MITIIIADDHEVVRRGLRMTIEGEEDMALLGEAGNGREAIDLVGAHQPDVLLLDIQMPEMDGIAAAAIIRQRHPATKVLMLTSFGNDNQLHDALQTGVTGYLLKDTSGDDLVAAIRGATKGEPQLHPEIARRLMQQMPRPRSPLAELTEREIDVLKCLAQGMSNREIGLSLSLAEVTVKGYVSTILSKLDLADRTQAALLAVRHGLVDLDDWPPGR